MNQHNKFDYKYEQNIGDQHNKTQSENINFEVKKNNMFDTSWTRRGGGGGLFD